MVADVAEGEEICISYVAFIHGTYLRRQKLQAGTAILKFGSFLLNYKIWINIIL